MRRSSTLTVVAFLTLCLCLTTLLGMVGVGSWAWWLVQPRPVALGEPTATPTPTAPKEEGRLHGEGPTALKEEGRLHGGAPTATRDDLAPFPTLSEADIERGRATLAAIDAAVAPPHDPLVLAQRFGLTVPGSDVPFVGKPYQVGDRERFWVSGERGDDVEREAHLQGLSDHAYWWVEEGYEVDQADLERAMGRFEAQTYPTTRALFGSEPLPGVDGDPRLHIYLGEVPGVAGYFSPPDLLPPGLAPASNHKEILYISIEETWPGEDYLDGVIAHEFVHLIHAATDPSEAAWVEEGLGELSILLNGYRVGSEADSFARDSDQSLIEWSGSLDGYAASYLFMLYLYERFGEGALSELMQTPTNGVQGVEAVLAARGTTFDHFFADWAAALLLNDRSLEVGQLGFIHAEEAPRRLHIGTTVERYPHTIEGDVAQYGIDALEWVAGAQSGTLSLRVRGLPSHPLLPPPPSGGEWMMWSGWREQSDSRLLREFDLTGVSEARLFFQSWYALESNYDFSYVVASTDGGVTWQALKATDSTRAYSPSPDYGPTFTGGAPDGAWARQEVDLTPLVGQRVLLGFETLTDYSENEAGFAVDDIEIPALGYAEDFEGGDGGWRSEGYARVGTTLLQPWIVQAISQGPQGTTRSLLPLSGNGEATLTIPHFGTDVERLILLISGASRATTARAPYIIHAEVAP